MNLANDPWIPVVDLSGAHRLASLRDIFADGDHLADLAANPCQRIALTRLLLCIAQAALDGPADEADWRACRPRLAPAALAYLDRWQHRFELFGEGAFLQVEGIASNDVESIKSANTLDATSAKGGTGLSMLWDHGAESFQCSADDPSLPLALICYVNFSCSGKVGKAVWSGVLFNGATAVAPSHAFLHSYILGDTLLDTVHHNLLPKSEVLRSVVIGDNAGWGRPVWEGMPKSPDDLPAKANASQTYLGRLVPLSRLVRLIRQDDSVTCIVGPPPDELRMARLPHLREPAASVVLSRKDKEPMYIAAKAGRHIWRDLEAILAVEQDCGSLALRPFLNAFVYPQKVEWFRIWVGGAVKGKNEAKYDDLAEWRADIPSVCVMDRTLTAYHAGIASAEEARKLLGGALGKYSKPDHDIPGKDPSQIPYEWAESLFWHGLDRRFAVLLAAVEANTDAKFAAWHAVIRDAMHAAYDQTCPHETPRQIQAYARGLQVLEAWKGGAHGQAD